MSIECQAAFWRRNVHDDSDAYAEFSELSDGFAAWSALLKRVYDDYPAFEVSTAEQVRTKIGIMADDLENYHNLTDTLDLLFHMAVVGSIEEEGAVSFLSVPKSSLKKAFKGSTAFPLEMLERHDFYFRFAKGGKETGSYKTCDEFRVFYDGEASLPAALKCLADHLPNVTAKEDYVPSKYLFYVADYASILGKASTKQADIHPLMPPIVRTAGARRAQWEAIVQALTDRMGLAVKASINPYVFPNWTVKMLRRNRTVCTFSIRPDRIDIRLPLTYEVAKKVILEKDALPPSINESVRRFGCCGCGKCSAQANIELVEGTRLCRLQTTNFITEESRLIGIEVTSPDEVAAIVAMVKELVAA